MRSWRSGAIRSGSWLPLHNLVAALVRLENSQEPADIQRVLALLADWLRAPEDDSLRRAFIVWLNRVLLPARFPAGTNSSRP